MLGWPETGGVWVLYEKNWDDLSRRLAVPDRGSDRDDSADQLSANHHLPAQPDVNTMSDLRMGDLA